MTPLTQAISRALIHFLWEGLLVALFLWITLSALKKKSANSRYIAACCALGAMAAMPFVTAWILYSHPVSARAAALPPVPVQMSAAAIGGRVMGVDIDPRAWIDLLQAWALPIWSAGAFLFSIRLVLGYKHAFTLGRRGKPAAHAVVETVRRLVRSMGVRRRVHVLISTMSDSPSVVGWLRPVILIPAGALIGLTPLQLEAVLAHEIGHIKRYDYLINLLQMLAETLLFYHPAVWWASKRIRIERELCCDDLAVRHSGNALRYARALTVLEKLRLQPPMVAMASTGGPLLYRIQRLVGLPAREEGPARLPIVLGVVLGTLCLIFNVVWVRGQDAPGVTVDLGSSSVIHRTPVIYPESVKKQGVTGTVELEVSLDEAGSVYDAHVLSGPDALRKSAIESVLNWHFSNGSARGTRIVNISFSDAGQKVRVNETPGAAGTLIAGVVGRQLQLVPGETPGLRTFENQGSSEAERQRRSDEEKRLALSRQREREIQTLKRQYEEASRSGTPTPELETLRAKIELAQKEFDAATTKRRLSVEGRTLTAITFFGISDAARSDLLARLPVREGDILSNQAVQAAAKTVWDFDGHLLPQFLPAGEGRVEMRITVSNEERTR